MIRLTRLATLTLLVTALSALLPAGASFGQGVRVAVYGDMPYSDEDQAFLEGPAAQRVVQDDRIALVIALGDLGRPETGCNDAWQLRQRTMWRERFQKPVILTPGDNDWTDCDRDNVPNRGSELARLDAMRRIHFAEPPVAIPPDWGFRAQPGQPENASWSVGGIRFATIHVVGTLNGRVEVKSDDPALAVALADARDVANRVWLAQSFAAARSAGDRAVVVAMQADPFDPEAVGRGNPVPEALVERCLASAAMAPTCRSLMAEVQRFPGPVLLVHGDTSPACLERVTAPDGARGFWRLNAWGDFSKPSDLTILDIDAAAEAPFRVSGIVEGHQMPDRCVYRQR